MIKEKIIFKMQVSYSLPSALCGNLQADEAPEPELVACPGQSFTILNVSGSRMEDNLQKYFAIHSLAWVYYVSMVSTVGKRVGPVIKGSLAQNPDWTAIIFLAP
jgi:hypothetical protein